MEYNHSSIPYLITSQVQLSSCNRNMIIITTIITREYEEISVVITMLKVAQTVNYASMKY